MTWNPSYLRHVEVPGREGYHLNGPLDGPVQVLNEKTAPFRVYPTEPIEVWAGQPTLFLWFADKAQALSVMGEHWSEDGDV